MLNKAELIGYLGKDPEVRYLPNGDAVVNVSVATSERWKDKATGEQKEHTEWHRVNAYGKLAEIIGQYTKKGSLVYLSGKIKTRKWQDKDGQDKYTTEIQADELKMLGGKNESGGGQGDDGGFSQDSPAPQQQRNNGAPQRSGQSAHQQGKANGYQPSTSQHAPDVDDDIPF